MIITELEGVCQMAAVVLPFQCSDPEHNIKERFQGDSQLICPSLSHQDEGWEEKGTHTNIYSHIFKITNKGAGNSRHVAA